MAKNVLASCSYQCGWQPQAETREWLVPSVTSVSRHKDGTVNPSSVRCTVMRQADGEAQAVTDMFVTITVFSGTTSGSVQRYAPGTAYAIAATTREICFSLYRSGTVASGTVQPQGPALDTVTIPVMTDGQDGKPGEGGKDAVTVRIDPAPLTLTKGAAWQGFVNIYVCEGGTERGPEEFSLPTAAQKAGFGTFDALAKQGFVVKYDGAAEINRDIQITVEQKYQVTLQIRTVSNGESVVGPVGPFTPPPMFWEDYPHSPLYYQFQTGQDAGDTRSDVVYHGITEEGRVIAWKCIQRHNWNWNKEPGTTGGSSYWQRAAGTYRLLATEVLLANSAFIGLLSGNQVRIYNQARQVVGQVSSIEGAPEAGKIILPLFIGGVMNPDTGKFSESPLFAVDAQGRTYHGGTTGQHIEIDPMEKALKVYDSTGKICALHSGRTLDYTKVAASTGNSSYSSTAAQTLSTKTFRDSGSTTQNVTLSGSIENTVSGKGSLTIKVPSFTITARKGSSGTGTDMAPMATGRVYVNLYVGGTLRRSLLAGEATDAVSMGESSSSSSGVTVTTSAFEFTESLTDGQKFKVVVEASGTLVNPVSTGKGTVTAVANAGLTADYVVTGYSAEYGANGFYLSVSNRNYVYCIFDNTGKLHFKVVSNGTVVVNSD